MEEGLARAVLSALDPAQEALLTEPCLLVDNEDKVVGTASKRDCHAMEAGTSPLHGAFSLFIFNDKHVLLPLNGHLGGERGGGGLGGLEGSSEEDGD